MAERRRGGRKSRLPIVDNCDGCGVCCLEQESPPGFAIIVMYGPQHAMHHEDVERFNSMPPDVREDYDAYVEHIKAGNPHPNNNVCIWFDEDTRQCKHYELRPEICRREVAPGDDSCRRWREAYKDLL